MKCSSRLIAFPCVVVPICWIACVFSNDVALAQLQIMTMQAACPGDGTACPGAMVPGLKNEPYQAQATTETRRTLADGSHTDLTITATVARDSEGRTVQTQTLSNGTKFTAIFDPVAKTNTDFTSDAKVAHVMTLPSTMPSGATVAIASGFAGATAGPAVGAVGGFFVEGHTNTAQGNNKLNAVTESLGRKAIEGIEVVGTRSTSTIPAGAIGNDKALTSTREIWESPELKLIISSTQNDPRFGQTTYSLTNIQRSEPEAALFQVPPDYKIEKIPMPTPPS
jgi:hypothetical protein